MDLVFQFTMTTERSGGAQRMAGVVIKLSFEIGVMVVGVIFAVADAGGRRARPRRRA
jgi:hypothetical protein